MTIFFILLCCWVGLEEERVCKAREGRVVERASSDGQCRWQGLVAKGLRCERHRYRCDRPRYLSERPQMLT
jgi:hypothetical protein